MEQLPEGYKFRRILPKDHTDVTKTLKVLTQVGDIDVDQFANLLQFWDSCVLPFNKNEKNGNPSDDSKNYMYNPIVIVDKDDTVMATGMLLIEPKIIHDCGYVGHVEDIAIRADQQGKKFGLHLIKHLYKLASDSGCYKVILDCSDTNVAFYEKCGLHKAGVEMQIRF